MILARFVLPSPGQLFEGAGLVVQEGRIVEVLGDPAVVRSRIGQRGIQCTDLGDVILTPGLVNAHAHLELGWADGLLSGADGFADWVTQLMGARRKIEPTDEVHALLRGAARLLETGTTTVGDIDASGARARLGAKDSLDGDADDVHPLILCFREILDGGNASRREEVLESLLEAVLPANPKGLLRRGLSPHAPFTVSPALLKAAAQYARREGLAVQIHWAESEEERRWLLEGSGPFAQVLKDSPGKSGLRLIKEAGLLGPSTSLVHANLPEQGEVQQVSASGATVVHCPGTHEFFGRDAFPWEQWLRAGVPLAIGTDSLASNADLDLGRELALARRAAPQLDPEVLWRAATVGGAQALNLAHEVGSFEQGKRADLAVFDLDVVSGTATQRSLHRSILERLTAGEGAGRGIMAEATRELSSL